MMQFRQYRNGWTTGTLAVPMLFNKYVYHVCIFVTGEPVHAEWFEHNGSRDYGVSELAALYAAVDLLDPPQPVGCAASEITRQARESRYQASTIHGSSKTRMQANCSTGLQDLDFEVASELHTPHHAVANDETPRRLFFEGRRVNARDLWRHQAARRANGRTGANGL